MAATANFLRESRRFDAPMVALIKVYLTSPSERTLYLAPSFVETPDYQLWEAGIVDYEPIEAPGSVGSPGPDLATAGVALSARHGLGFQPITKNITNLFVDYEWLGAKVEVYQWSTRLTDWADAFLSYTGRVQNFVVGSDRCEVRLLQREDWKQDVEPADVARDRFPRAPDRSVGLTLGIDYGRDGLPMRPPWPEFANIKDLEAVHGGQIGASALTVDTGRGAGQQNQRVLIARHAIKAHSDPTLGLRYYIKQDGILVPIDPTALVNAADGAGFELADDFAVAYYPVSPVDVRTGTNGKNPRFALDPFNETSFAEARYPGNDFLAWTLPAINPPGTIVEAYLVVGYQSTTLSGAQGQIRIFHTLPPTVPSSKTFNLTTAATPTVARFSIGTSWGSQDNNAPPENTVPGMPIQPWDFSECNLQVYVNTGASPPNPTSIKVYFVGIQVKYKPAAKIWRPAYDSRPRFKETHRKEDIVYALLPRQWTPPDTEIESTMFGTFEGMQDDASGTYTGTALALIERPCDIARHLLRTFGGQSASQIQTGSSTFGSFVDARSLKTWRGGELKAGLQIAEKSDLGSPLESLARAGNAWAYIDRFTDKWHWVSHRVGTGTVYARPVYRDDLFSLEIEGIPTSRIPSGIGIRYAWDAFTRGFVASTYVAVGGSQSGHRYLNLRDESLKVEGNINDRIDVDEGSAQIAAVDYGSLIEMCQAAKAALDALTSGVGKVWWMVTTPLSIVAGYNDKLDFNDGSVKAATIAAGDYSSFETLATAVAAALNAAGSSGWTCVYNRTTRKITIDRSSGTKTLLVATGANRDAASGYVGLGYDSVTGDVTGGTAGAYEVEEDRVIIEAVNMTSGGIRLLFATGTYGTNQAAPKSAAGVLGFDGSYDREPTGNQNHWTSDTPKGNRELVLRRNGERVGFSRELPFDARAIYDTDTARQLRNELFDLMCRPRAIVRWVTTRMPDVHRGELVRLDDLDNFGVAFPGGNGLWASRLFRVISVVQRLGSSFEQLIEAVEVEAFGLEALSEALPAPAAAIVAWWDTRDGSNYQSYALAISTDGADVWTDNGVQLSNGAGNFGGEPQICPDGEGGCFVVFLARVSGVTQVRLTHLDSGGGLVAGWPSGGLAITTNAGNKNTVAISPDGLGGCVIAWSDGGSPQKGMTQRVNADATFPAGWESPITIFTDGTLGTGGTLGQFKIASDQEGGAFFFLFASSGANRNVYAQRVRSDGSIPAGWSTSLGVLALSGGSSSPIRVVGIGLDAVPGATVGAMLAYIDNGGDAQVRRINADGSFAWAAVAVSSAYTSVSTFDACSDGLGGMIFTFSGTISTNWETRAQRVDPAGALKWGSTGASVIAATPTATTSHLNPVCIATGDGGGGIFMLANVVSGVTLILAQRIGPTGAVQWGASGVQLNTGVANSDEHVLASDNSQGAFAIWQTSTNDLAARRVDRDGIVQWLAEVEIRQTSNGAFDPRATSGALGLGVSGGGDEEEGGAEGEFITFEGAVLPTI